jgi:osmotically-inducible protein OsmY
VVLAGTVPSRQARRDAEAIAESLRGVHEVENRLRVEGKDTQVY